MRALTLDQIEDMIRTAMTADDWSTVADLEPQLTWFSRPQPTPGLEQAAHWYAAQGLMVFPLQPGQKIPHRGTRGCKEATTDPAQIATWWQRWPGSNVAIATGHIVDVIDIDGPIGVKSWAGLRDLPPVLGVASTPRAGGSHLYVAATGDGNSAGIFPGVDVRGLGGYVVAPPSVNAEGVTYTWRHLLSDVGVTLGAEFDPALCDRCSGPAGEHGWCQPCIDECRAYTARLDSTKAAAA